MLSQVRRDRFVPSLPPHKRTEPMPTAPLSHIFDSNDVRKLGELPSSQWDKLWRAWRAKGYTTGWIPWVVREVVGTNFYDDYGNLCGEKKFKQIVRSVRRFDMLAEGDVLPEFNELFVYSMYEYAGGKGGPSRFSK